MNSSHDTDLGHGVTADALGDHIIAERSGVGRLSDGGGDMGKMSDEPLARELRARGPSPHETQRPSH
jgi:hypothetical protein